MTERHVQHTDNTRQKEVHDVQAEQNHLLQGQGRPGADVHPLSGKDLVAASQTWQQQFESLPRVPGSEKLDTSKFGEKDWQNLHAMYTEMNKPGGAIDTARATQAACENACKNAQGSLHFSDQTPQRPRQ